MAQHRLGKADEAGRWFFLAVGRSAEEEKNNNPRRWQDRLTLRLLKAEAERTLDIGVPRPK
jgi:hypothetical protein